MESKMVKQPENLEEEIDAFVRDVCSVVPKSKSEVRERLEVIILSSHQSLVKELWLEMEKVLVGEMDIARQEGQPTSRLTSSYIRLHTLLKKLLK